MVVSQDFILEESWGHGKYLNFQITKYMLRPSFLALHDGVTMVQWVSITVNYPYS